MASFRKLKLVGMALAASTAFTAVPAEALTINLVDGGGVTGTWAEIGFNMAARYWESVLVDSGTVNFQVRYAPLDPGILGSTGSALATYVPISAYQAALAADATSALDAQAVAHLSTLSSTGSVTMKVPQYMDVAAKTGADSSSSRLAPDGEAISNTIALTGANLVALIGGTSGATFDGQITFSSNFKFDFNPSDGIKTGYYDFIGVAIHEMGHALGFVSGTDDFDYIDYIDDESTIDDAWWAYGADMFRYSEPGVLDITPGTDTYFSLDGGLSAYEGAHFSTGDYNGDGSQGSHWKAPGTCTGFVGIMNPYLCSARGAIVTGTDLALFDAIGWDLSAKVRDNPRYVMTSADVYRAFVPEPGTWAMMIAGFAFVGAAMRRRGAAVSVSFG